RLDHPRFITESRERPVLRSFPTRRSSDLNGNVIQNRSPELTVLDATTTSVAMSIHIDALGFVHGLVRDTLGARETERIDVDRHRSEEHTSELQSRFDLVCRLLLEKKTSAS